MRVSAVNEGGKLREVHISGDFFFFPQEALPDLEKALEGTSAETQEVTSAVARFYEKQSVESPGVKPEDFASVLIPSAA